MIPDSPRKQIRLAVAQLLEGIEGVKGVHLNRVRKMFPEEMPALIVYTRSEQAEIEVAAPREYKRTLRLAVEVIVEQDDDLVNPDDVVDDIGTEVEARMMRDETLGGLASDVRLSDTEMETNHDGASQAAAARITFEIEYWTQAVTTDETELDDFLRVRSEITPEGAVEDTEPAVDEITIEQN